MKTVIIYGTLTGNTESAAKAIAAEIEGSVVADIASFDLAQLSDYDTIILGTATSGFGELNEDWEDKIIELQSTELDGKKLALFALGDQVSYSDSFVGSLGELYDRAVDTGAELVGFTSTDGYEFDESEGVRDGQFVGLVLDEENQAGLTDERIKNWVKQILA